MGKKFRDWDVDQMWLLPPSAKELVPEGHPAHFVRELVRSELDLGAILGSYRDLLIAPDRPPRARNAWTTWRSRRCRSLTSARSTTSAVVT